MLMGFFAALNLILLLLCPFSGVSAAGSISSGEYYALYDLYESTDGNNWTWNKFNSTIGVLWNFSDSSSDPCGNPPWEGVNCDCGGGGSSANNNNSICSLIALFLPNMNMHGSIPVTIANLTELQLMNFSANQLLGTLPNLTTRSSLEHLSVLDLSKNQLYYSLPSWLWSLRALEVLDLARNAFSGDLPSECFENTTRIQSLDLSNNSFTGPIPWSLYGLHYLEELSLSSNNFSGKLNSSFGGLTSLVTLVLYDNQLTGTIPSALTSLPTLLVMDLANNKLSGPLPEVPHFVPLKFIALSSNMITNTIPSSYFTKLPVLQLLDLGRNQLNGSLPSSINDVAVTLRVLELSANQLSGELPETLFQLQELITLFIQDNRFHGSISESIGELSNLLSFDIARNFFTGSLPSSFYNLTKLITIDIVNNSITGILSANVTHMTSLRHLAVSFNLLTGTIPTAIGELSNLTELFLSYNSFTGTMPYTIVNMTKLYTLYFTNNFLTGTIPVAIHTLPKVLAVNLYGNQFTGSAFEAMNGFPSLLGINIGFNYLTGNAPVSLAWFEISSYIIQNNLFEGHIPLNKSQTRILYYVDVSVNLMTGSLPSWLESSSALVSFIASNNSLTGSIPNKLPSSLLALVLNVNKLTGSLPISIGDCKDMTYLRMNNNQFTGSLPKSMLNLTAMSFLTINNNQFTGTLDNLYRAPLATGIATVDVSSNFFTGTIPFAQLFSTSMSNLTSFSASVNCFSGTISENICSVQSLQAIALDGLSSATKCQTPIFSLFKDFLPTFVSQKQVSGAIPSCLFALPRLKSLHLSGNSFNGQLLLSNVSGFSITPSLVNLSISNNQLSGTLPLSVQTHPWQNLDFSFNRFAGTLSSEFYSFPYIANVSQSVAGQRNRLSGHFPTSLLEVENINILRGNLFSCNIQRSDIPMNDPKFDSYACGSDTVNRSLFFWTVSFPLFCIFLWLSYNLVKYTFECGSAHKRRESVGGERKVEKFSDLFLRVLRQFQSWRKCCIKPDGNISALSCFEPIKQVTIRITAIAVIILLPIYALALNRYSTYEFVYGWQVSALLVTGSTPGIILTIAFILLLTISWWWLVDCKAENYTRNTDDKTENDASVKESKNTPHKDIEEDEHKDQEEHATTTTVSSSSHQSNYLQSKRKYKFLLRCFYVGLFIINGLIMLLLDVLYVLGLNTVNSSDFIMVDYTLAVFKLVWNEIFVIRWFNAMKHGYLQFFAPELIHSLHHQHEVEARKNITFQSSLIVLNTIIAPVVATAFASSNCFYNTIAPSPTPPAGFEHTVCTNIEPVGERSIKCLDYAQQYESITYASPFIYSYQCSSFIIINFASVYVYMAINVSLALPMMKIVAACILHALPPESPWRKNMFLLMVPPNTQIFDASAFMQQQQETSYNNEHTQLFGSRDLVIRTIQYLAILLTFGVCFPPLAFTMCIGILVTITYEETVIGRVLMLAKSADRAVEAGFFSRSSAMIDNNDQEQQLREEQEGVVIKIEGEDGDKEEEKGEHKSTVTTTPLATASSSCCTWYFNKIKKDNAVAQQLFRNPVLVWLTLSGVSVIYAFRVFDTLADESGLQSLFVFALTVLVGIFPTVLFGVHLVYRRYFDNNNNKKKKEEVVAFLLQTVVVVVGGGGLSKRKKNNSDDGNGDRYQHDIEISAIYTDTDTATLTVAKKEQQQKKQSNEEDTMIEIRNPLTA